MTKQDLQNLITEFCKEGRLTVSKRIELESKAREAGVKNSELNQMIDKTLKESKNNILEDIKVEPTIPEIDPIPEVKFDPPPQPNVFEPNPVNYDDSEINTVDYFKMELPSPGPSVKEVIFSKWLVNPGDYVLKNQSIAIVKTQNATLELSSKASGTIFLEVDAGEIVHVGQVVCLIDTKAPKPKGVETVIEQKIKEDEERKRQEELRRQQQETKKREEQRKKQNQQENTQNKTSKIDLPNTKLARQFGFAGLILAVLTNIGFIVSAIAYAYANYSKKAYQSNPDMYTKKSYLSVSFSEKLAFFGLIISVMKFFMFMGKF